MFTANRNPRTIDRRGVKLSRRTLDHYFCISILICALVVGPVSAQDFSAPKDCFFACKEQFGVLNEFRDFTLPEQIQKAFGDPQISTRGGYQVAHYQGAAVDLFLLSKAEQLTGVAVLVKGKAEHARVPFMDSLPENNIASAFPQQKVDQSCRPNGRSTKVNRGSIALYAPCYGAKPGSYRDFSYAYDSNAGNATPRLIGVGVANGSNPLEIAEIALKTAGR